MGEKMEEGVDLPSLESQLSQTHITLEQIGHGLSQVDQLQEKLLEVNAFMHGSENDIEKELEAVWQGIEGTMALLTYLKSKERLVEVQHVASTLPGIKDDEEVGRVGINATHATDIDLSAFDNPGREKWIGISKRSGSFDGYDGAHIGDIVKSVHMVTDVMGSLVKRVIMAENETAIERKKVCLSKEEIRRKILQIQILSAKVEKMENFALRANSILDEMRKKVEDLVQEMSLQRQQASENEQELCRVKQEFDSLRSYVNILINIRETLLSSVEQIQTMDRFFERVVSMNAGLENEKMQKEAEVQKLIAENVRLRAILDKKEAHLVAMHEQCKVMALSL